MDAETVQGRIAAAKREFNLDLSRLGIREVPPEVWNLTHLRTLNLDDNELTALPPQIGNLAQLTHLYVRDNRLTDLPAEFTNLSRLERLLLSGNQLAQLPPEILELDRLEMLYIGRNQLTGLPADFSRLGQLTLLDLGVNRLSTLPKAITQLTDLTVLDLSRNKLTTLPPEISSLTRLTNLYLTGNPLTTPPPAVIAQGAQAIVAFMRGLLAQGTPQWRSKLLIVGQGNCGKTSLVKALTGKPHNAREDTTHGLQITELSVAHPDHEDVTMRLAAWDFGGQEIYHATHQFFLTGQSLFVVVWSARAGYEHGRLRYWLDLITARAPQAPIIVVATHAAQRAPDLPTTQLQKDYPQIRGFATVDNETRDGIGDLHAVIARHAAGLPLMGKPWPTIWQAVQSAIRDDEHTYMPLSQMRDFLARRGAKDATTQQALMGALHDLGELLHWADDPELASTVVLKPQWLSERISAVLDSQAVADRRGLLRAEDVDRRWSDIDLDLRRDLLYMMDKYDVSYRIHDTTDPGALAIVVDRLPWEPPDYSSAWAGVAPPQGHEVRVRYAFDGLIPPGIPTWFIAREHRFTTAEYRPWRTGALLRHPDGRNLALIELSADSLSLSLTVRGNEPDKFMYLLDDGLQQTFDRYEGLKVTRLVPCPCRPGCTHVYNYDWLHRHRRRRTVECPLTDETLETELLLRGIPSRGAGSDTEILQLLHKSFGQQTELIQRSFTGLRQLQSVNCPTVFTITPARRRINLGVTPYVLRLYCDEPGSWHQLPDDQGCYKIKDLDPWLRNVVPHLTRIAKILSTATAIAVPILGIAAVDLNSRLKDDLSSMKDLLSEIPQITTDGEGLHDTGARPAQQAYDDADYRAIHNLLAQLDPKQRWGGLSRVVTPEGQVHYLCHEHAARYRDPAPRPTDL